jgi:hypothetical protein
MDTAILTKRSSRRGRSIIQSPAGISFLDYDIQIVVVEIVRRQLLSHLIKLCEY